MTGPRRSRFVSNTLALAVTTVVSTLLALVQIKILAGTLARDEFGWFVSLRGFSLLISMVAVNGLPQLLVRFLPVHDAHGEKRRAAVLTAVCFAGSLALTALFAAVVHSARGATFPAIPVAHLTPTLLFWFYATTLGVSLKLVLYGGLNGLRRLPSQTLLESASLVAQVAWIGAEAARGTLDLEALFRVLGVVSLATVVVGLPWYLSRLAADTREPGGGSPGATEPSYGGYWLGAAGLSMVAVAFTDVDRYVLSGVLAFETLSLFHVTSRVARLANRFLGVPVLAFQPEVSRLEAEGRRADVERSTRVFFKFNVLASALVTGVVVVFAAEIIELVSSREFVQARPLLLVLAASVPITAMTAPLTAVMKSLDRVRQALVCDLAWAVVYVVSLLLLGRAIGLVGAGIAQLLAAVVQLLLAVRLSEVRPSGADIARTVARVAVCAGIPFAVLALAHALPLEATPRLLLKLALLPPALWAFRRLALAARVLDTDEREGLRAMLAGNPAGAIAIRILT